MKDPKSLAIALDIARRSRGQQLVTQGAEAPSDREDAVSIAQAIYAKKAKPAPEPESQDDITDDDLLQAFESVLGDGEDEKDFTLDEEVPEKPLVASIVDRFRLKMPTSTN